MRVQMKKQALSCGASVTAIVTAVVMSGLLPPEMSTPEVASALSGLLSTLASAIGLCTVFRGHHDDTPPKEENSK